MEYQILAQRYPTERKRESQMRAKYVILHFLVATLKKEKPPNRNLLKYKHFNLVYSHYYHFIINRKMMPRYFQSHISTKSARSSVPFRFSVSQLEVTTFQLCSSSYGLSCHTSQCGDRSTALASEESEN